MTRFQFVDDHQATFEVKRMCEVLEVGRSSFYAWQAAAPARAKRAAADAELAGRIKAVQAEDRSYGAPRVTAELNDGAQPQDKVNHKRVARVMREQHLPGVKLRRRVRRRSRSPPTARHRTCCNGTSTPTHRTASTSVTSPTCRWPAARTSTSRP